MNATSYLAQGNYFPYWPACHHFPPTLFVWLFVSSGKHEFLMRIFRGRPRLYLASSAGNELYGKSKKRNCIKRGSSSSVKRFPRITIFLEIQISFNDHPF